MNAPELTVLSTGLVTSVGLTSAASCAAIRAKLTNPVETGFIDGSGEFMVAHEVPLERPWRGLAKLVEMAVMCAEEALADTPRRAWGRIPLLLCVAEQDRPGRIPGLDDKLLPQVQTRLGERFAPQSFTFPHGRIGVALALAKARALIHASEANHVLIVAADTYLHWETLAYFLDADRLLTAANPNGFIPGEGAAALLVGPSQGEPALACEGIGFGEERGAVESDQPLQATGLAQAIRSAAADAGHEMHEVDFRITDISGEQYYFKEAALALARTLHQPKAQIDLWHPAESIGETGSVAGGVVLAVADAACRKQYANGPCILTHFANDDGRRAAVSLRFRGR